MDWQSPTKWPQPLLEIGTLWLEIRTNSYLLALLHNDIYGDETTGHLDSW